MSINTIEEKASLIGYGLPFRLMLPFPRLDGSIDQGDRQHLAGLYAGIETAPPVDQRPIAFATFSLAQRSAVVRMLQRSAVITLER